MSDNGADSQESGPPSQPRYPWWSVNWPHVGTWIGVVVAFIAIMITVFFATVSLLRETHVSYQQALASWETSLRGDVRALRDDIQDELAELRRRIDELEEQVCDVC